MFDSLKAQVLFPVAVPLLNSFRSGLNDLQVAAHHHRLVATSTYNATLKYDSSIGRYEAFHVLGC